MTQLTEHFSLEELTFSSTAARLEIANDPTPEIIANLTVTARHMEDVRALLGFPIHVDSGYRCFELNRAVGGARNSAHLSGFAVDFICPNFGTPPQVVAAIQASGNIVFDQLIQEGTWVHISFDPQMRRQVLTAHFSANGTTYTAGA